MLLRLAALSKHVFHPLLNTWSGRLGGKRRAMTAEDRHHRVPAVLGAARGHHDSTAVAATAELAALVEHARHEADEKASDLRADGDAVRDLG